jgi:hypothetical protein
VFIFINAQRHTMQPDTFEMGLLNVPSDVIRSHVLYWLHPVERMMLYLCCRFTKRLAARRAILPEVRLVVKQYREQYRPAGDVPPEHAEQMMPCWLHVLLQVLAWDHPLVPRLFAIYRTPLALWSHSLIWRYGITHHLNVRPEWLLPFSVSGDPPVDLLDLCLKSHPPIKCIEAVYLDALWSDEWSRQFSKWMARPDDMHPCRLSAAFRLLENSLCHSVTTANWYAKKYGAKGMAHLHARLIHGQLIADYVAIFLLHEHAKVLLRVEGLANLLETRIAFGGQQDPPPPVPPPPGLHDGLLF